jgi:carbon starvation protein CstA
VFIYRTVRFASRPGMTPPAVSQAVWVLFGNIGLKPLYVSALACWHEHFILTTLDAATRLTALFCRTVGQPKTLECAWLALL